MNRSANYVLTLTRNCLELTKRMYESVLKQTVPTATLFIDNGSTDGTADWLCSLPNAEYLLFNDNHGVSAGWNSGLRFLFDCIAPQDHVLVINNDVELAPWTYEALLLCDLPFVTGVASDDRGQIDQPCPPVKDLSDHPDFSMFLIRRDAWQMIGQFDESMKFYAQDCDYHIRGYRAGVEMKKACVPYFHYSSATLKHAKADEQNEILAQANRDREVFQSKYGCQPGTADYYELFRKLNV